MQKNKGNMVIWVVVVIVFIGVIVFISNKDARVSDDGVQIGEETTMDNLQETNGVKITILKEGTGAVAKSGDVVSMNYTGTLVDGTVFDSNIDPKFQRVEPFVFNLGAGQVIQGWDVGIVGMKVGEKRKLEITPEYAYGATGAGGVIPPNATLNFEVELLAVN